MIKLFGKGLGIFDHPFDTGSPTGLDPVRDNGGTIVRDTTTRLLGSLGNPATIKTLQDSNPPINFDNLHTTLQLPNKDIRRNFDLVDLPRPVKDLGVRPQVFSAESGGAPFETLFHDFDIEAFPFYNFWVPDELTNDRDERGDRKLEDIPRFIKITWNPAPDLPDPEDKVRAKSVVKRKIKPVIFSREIENPRIFVNKGVHFMPEHLQASGFKTVKGIVANGFMAPGVLEAIVDMPLANTGIETHNVRSSDPINHFDEDAFLTDKRLAGISIHELKSQVNQVTNGIAAMARIGAEGVSSDLTSRKESLVDGKFSINKSRQPGGMMTLTSLHPSSPTLGFSARTAQPAKVMSNDLVMELAERISQPPHTNTLKETAQVKVKFFNPSISGLVDPKKVNLMTAPHHVETLSSIAPSLHNLEVLSQTNLSHIKRQVVLPSLPSPKIKPFEYTGYIIEKYMLQKSGAFVKIDEIDIPSREADFYIDTKVLYGEVYRYRIKCMFRWTRPRDHDIDGKNPLVTMKFGSHTAPLATHKSSYFTSEWSHTWAHGKCVDDQPPGPPDELTVRPESHRKRIVITFRLPENSQKDILKMRLFRKIQDQHGDVISDWMPIKESDAQSRTVDFAPQNVIFFDYHEEFFQKSNQRMIYAAQTISRHGEYSVLSEQLCARLNADYFTKGEFPVEFISSPGVRLEYHGAFSTIPNKVTRTEIVQPPPATPVGKSPGVAYIVVAGRDTMGNVSLDIGKYVMRIQSLDTGEIEDIPFQTTFSNLQDRQEVSRFDFYVPTHSVPGKNSDKFNGKNNQKLKKQLENVRNKPLKDTRNEEDEVDPRDRSLKGERWKR